MHCDTSNIDTSSSDEIILSIVVIAGSISHRYQNIEVIVSGQLPRDIDWSARRVKVKKSNPYLGYYCEKSNKMTFIRPDPDSTLPDKLLNMKLYYKDQLQLIESESIKFSKSIIESLQDVLSRQSSPQLSSSCLSQSLIISPPPSSLSRSNLPPVQKLSQTSLSQSLLTTAAPFNP